MNRLKAKHFLLSNTFPTLKKGHQRDTENRKISDLMGTAIKNKAFTVNNKDEVDIIEFCRWASLKKTTKNSPTFRFPWLANCLNLPPEPVKPIVSVGGAIINIQNNVLPVDIKSCQQHLVNAWEKVSALQKENNELLKEVIQLRDKKRKQKHEGEKAAAKQWSK